MKKVSILVVFGIIAGMNSFAQSSPEELCDKFTAAFFHSDTTLLRSICSPDKKAQEETLSQLNDVYIQGMKEENINWNQILSVTSGAMLKDGKGKAAKSANVIITFTDKDATFKISIWNCYQADGVWKLGNKISLKKV